MPLTQVIHTIYNMMTRRHSAAELTDGHDFKSLGSPRQFGVFHENSLLFIKLIAKVI